MKITPDKLIVAAMKEIRRKLHRFPELAFQEKKTAALIMRELDQLGILYTSGVSGTGIVATLGSSDNGCGCVGLRADMDALPIQEATGLSFSSQREGIMHACGHDGHVAMLLGAAAILKRVDLPGKVILIFQPAEESGNGADKVMRSGKLDDVQMIFGGHLDTHYQTGSMTVDSGLICSYTDPFDIRIHGHGGHAARPHEATDAVVVASNLVMNVQTLVSRRIDPSQAAVVTIGKMVSGTVNNAIAEDALLEGTVRSSHLETRERILSCLNRFVQGAKKMYNIEIELNFHDGLQAVINDQEAARIARQAAVTVLGSQNVISQGPPSLGGEDFSFYQQNIPGCLVRFGASAAREHGAPSHSSRFDFDENVLAYGASWLAQVAFDGLHSLNGVE